MSKRVAARKKVVRGARKKAGGVRTARRSSVTAVRGASRGEKSERTFNLVYTYDMPVREIDRRLGLTPGKNADMKIGVYLKKIGHPGFASVLKRLDKIAESYNRKV